MGNRIYIKGKKGLLSALLKSEDILEKKLRANVLKSAHLIAASAKINAPKSTSELSSSIKVRVTGKSSAEVYTDLEYASTVEFGRKPGAIKPPLWAIKEWIKDKHIEVGNINSAAFLIARSIGIKGIEPNSFMADAIKQNRATVVALIKSTPHIAIKRSGL